MKIGLEFEGVIVEYATGKMMRWSKLPEETRIKIKKLIYERREPEEPVDRYDCLAEVRTLPLPDPTPEQLIEALFTQMELATRAFAANGLEIRWWEQNIPDDLHREIQYDIEHPAKGYKEKKYTETITADGIQEYKVVGNRYRGGGLHINVSPIPQIIAPAYVVGIHHSLKYTRSRFDFKSHYRTNMLFRRRFDTKDTDQKEPIVEYMTAGFNVPTLFEWRKDLKKMSDRSWYSDRNKSYEHMRWAWPMMDFTKAFFRAMNG